MNFFHSPTFQIGLNLPWITYGCDFGASLWSPSGGLSTRISDLDRILGRLADQGVEALRWFLFADGRAGIQTDAEGNPEGLDGSVRPDLDAAAAALGRHGMKALFVLFDFSLANPRRVHHGVQTGGRRRWIAHPNARARLIERIAVPAVAHLAGSPAILGWDLLNEPDWITFGVGGWIPGRAVGRATLRTFLGGLAEGIRSASPHPLTVGLARPRALPLVRGLGLDFYQVHWYDRLADPESLDRPPSSHGLDAPLVLGEFPTRDSRLPPEEILRRVAAAGYAGAFAWSALASDPCTDPAFGMGGPIPWLAAPRSFTP